MMARPGARFFFYRNSILLRLLLLPVALLCVAPLPALCQTPSEEQLMLEAKQAEEKHDFTGAARIYGQILKAQPHQPNVLQKLGLVNYLSGRFAQAIPPLQEAAQLDPSLWGADLFLGISYYRSGDFTRAAAALRQTLALQPDLPEAEYWYGTTLAAEGNLESAIPYLSRAAKAPRTSLDAQAQLADAYQAAAQSYGRKVIERDPNSYRAHQLKAESLAWQGRDSAALLEYQRALDQKPDLEGVHRAMGVIAWQQRNFEQAARQFEAELKLNSLDSLSNLRLGEYWLAKGQPSMAGGFLNSAIHDHTAKAGEAWRFLGIAEMDLKHFDQATKALEQAARINPKDPSNHQMLMQIYQQTGQPGLAAKEKLLLEQLHPAGNN